MEASEFQEITRLAQEGDADAQFFLGAVYHFGRGVEQDDAWAVAWFEKAAAQGLATAQYMLGGLYAYSTGAEQDHVQAVAWFEKAAAQGFAHAQFALGGSYANGEGVEQDHVQAVAWYEKAAAQDLADAKFALGVSFDNGEGVEQDHVQAVAWYEKAAAQGDAAAQEMLDDLQSKDEEVEAQGVIHAEVLRQESKILEFPKKVSGDEILRRQAAVFFSYISSEQLFEHVRPLLDDWRQERDERDSTLIHRVERRLETGNSDSLISLEESLTHEYKASLRTPYPDWPEQQTDEKGKHFLRSGKKSYASKKELRGDLETSCLKTIVAFLNTKGGTLIIGVHEKDNEKTLVGIEREIGFERELLDSNDAYQKCLVQLIINRIGSRFASNYVSIELKPINDLTICVVRCQEYQPAKNDVPALLDEEKTFRRTGNRTDEVKGANSPLTKSSLDEVGMV